MTKTEMRKLAQQSTRYGYFDYGSELAVDCPLCRKHIRVAYHLWAADGKGKRLNKIAQLRAGMVEHFSQAHDKHEIVVDWHPDNHGYPYRATCKCGWQSVGYVAKHAAVSMGDYHIADLVDG